MPTDLARLPDPVAALGRLPAGAAVILRDAGHPEREAVARALRAATSRRGQVLLVSGDPELADRVRADGLHLPERDVGGAAARTWRRRNPHRLLSAAAHSLAALRRAAGSGCDVVLLSPVFPTASHPGAPALGPYRAAAMARSVGVPVLALGGVEAGTLGRLPPVFAGIAAIGLFAILRPRLPAVGSQ
ncbi:MAG: thiamine phosphate synthase [Pseudomonadota bacterium]|nr:thiamine phosphate synthase [Pseudomonadota bacterium]